MWDASAKPLSRAAFDVVGASGQRGCGPHHPKPERVAPDRQADLLAKEVGEPPGREAYAGCEIGERRRPAVALAQPREHGGDPRVEARGGSDIEQRRRDQLEARLHGAKRQLLPPTTAEWGQDAAHGRLGQWLVRCPSEHGRQAAPELALRLQIELGEGVRGVHRVGLVGGDDHPRQSRPLVWVPHAHLQRALQCQRDLGDVMGMCVGVEIAGQIDRVVGPDVQHGTIAHPAEFISYAVLRASSRRAASAPRSKVIMYNDREPVCGAVGEEVSCVLGW